MAYFIQLIVGTLIIRFGLIELCKILQEDSKP